MTQTSTGDEQRRCNDMLRQLARSNGLASDRAMCAEPVEHIFHAMADRKVPDSPAAHTLRTAVSNHPLVSHFIPHHDDDHDLPAAMLASLRRCLARKKKSAPWDLVDQQHSLVLHSHIKRLHQHPVEPAPLPPASSLWDQMWNGLVKA